MGSAALFELARRGRRVLGLEQFPLVHDRGSSHGHTRVIRKAYYEHPAYVPLVQRAYQRWYALEQLQGRHLLTECGCLSIGRTDSALLTGVLASAAQHALPIERFTADELRRRFPMFRFSDEYAGVFEREAGFLYVEDCVRGYIEEARKLGAEVHAEEPVLEWAASGQGVRVQTAVGEYMADRLVITAGPWAGQMLARLGAPLTVMRQVLLWFAVNDARQFRRDRFPIYITDTPAGHFYGFPVLDCHGAKVAQHYGAPELRSPEAIDRNVTAADEQPLRAFLDAHLPGISGPCHRGQVCIYTLTPDRHFLIDRHPDHPQVAFAAGFSGHGFKFASVVGEILADLAEHGRTDLPIEMFRVGRFASATWAAAGPTGSASSAAGDGDPSAGPSVDP
jgi:sarcosine oxidase